MPIAAPGDGTLAGVMAQEMPSHYADLVCRSAGVLPLVRASRFRVGSDLGERWEHIRECAEPAFGAER